MLNTQHTKVFAILLSLTLLTGLSAAQSSALDILSGDLNMSSQDLTFGNDSQYQMRYDAGADQFVLENDNDNTVLYLDDGDTTANFQDSVAVGSTLDVSGDLTGTDIVNDTQIEADAVGPSEANLSHGLNDTGDGSIGVEASGSSISVGTGGIGVAWDSAEALDSNGNITDFNAANDLNQAGDVLWENANDLDSNGNVAPGSNVDMNSQNVTNTQGVEISNTVSASATQSCGQEGAIVYNGTHHLACGDPDNSGSGNWEVLY